MAAAMVVHLVDIQVWLRPCAMGSSTKPVQDKQVIDYVQRTVFEYHPLKADETFKGAWQDCITSIDNRARDIKRRMKERAARRRQLLNIISYVYKYILMLYHDQFIHKYSSIGSLKPTSLVQHISILCWGGWLGHSI